MIRSIHDFLDRWKEESQSTIKVFSALTDESLQQAIPGGRTLGRLANHITETLTEMPHHLGLPIQEDYTQYSIAEELIEVYRKHSDKLAGAVISNWSDADLEQETDMYGFKWKKGFGLWVLITHQAHHRAQITVLMRFAGLKVPGIYGPSKEEWEAWGKTPLE